MKNQKQKNAEIKDAAYQAAINEGKIDTVQLLQEIEPLIKEYFIGEFDISKNALKLSFANGQAFNLFVKEVI